MDRFSEKDWKLFRSKIAGWQEAYMDRLNEEYMEILSGEGAASEKFWKLEKRIKEDKLMKTKYNNVFLQNNYVKNYKEIVRKIEKENKRKKEKENYEKISKMV